MASGIESEALEAGSSEWRTFLRRGAIRDVDVAELEDHLRGQVRPLTAAGLSGDEAFLVAVKRVGAIDALSSSPGSTRTGCGGSSSATSGSATDGATERRREMFVAVALAVVAALLVKLPELFGVSSGQIRRLSPGTPAWRCSRWSPGIRLETAADRGRMRTLAAAFALAALAIDLPPSGPAATPSGWRLCTSPSSSGGWWASPT